MDNALGESQTIVLLGGTSEIGRAIVAKLLSPSTT
nr:decaprenylphospho-beta-D-erythro-pentofuranosid-2-ulose 2-reductase [Acidimicrobiia bacterium]